MSQSQRISSLEPYRLPVKFDGELIIHLIVNLDATEDESEVEERWIQKQPIGKGGFGEVWLQEEERGGELRAVKRLAQVVLGVDFTRELVTLAALVDHKQFFVQFYGWYEDIARKFVFLAMEYVEGGDLSQYLKDPIIRSEAREITRQLLQGLVIMHEKLICHRDIKPKVWILRVSFVTSCVHFDPSLEEQNVLVVSLKPIWVKLADFGVSKLEQDTYLRTQAGTLEYSAPELFGLLPRRLKPSDVYTNAVDMWSLGCLVHEMLTTERPFLEDAHDSDPESSLQFDTCTFEPQADIDMIIEFCRDERDFPGEVLENSGASAEETGFVKALLLPDPRLRLTAVNALASPWISGQSESGSVTVTLATRPSSILRLTRFVDEKDLTKFFPEITTELVGQAEMLVTELMKQGCPKGIATSLEVLVLYDLALLIGDGDSMVYDDEGRRIDILHKLLDAIARVYDLAREKGILTTRFLNARVGSNDVTAPTVNKMITGHEYGGVVRVGTGLRGKILDKFVLGIEMKKPLLMIVIADQEAEGESTNLLEDVLTDCLSKLGMDEGSKGAQSIAFQFLRIGDDASGLDLFRRLANSKMIGKFVNYRHVRKFDHDLDSQAYWMAITHILLGAISNNWK